MKEQTIVTSIRLPSRLLASLKKLAHKRSLREGRELRWSGLVREAIEAMLVSNPCQQLKGDD